PWTQPQLRDLVRSATTRTFPVDACSIHGNRATDSVRIVLPGQALGDSLLRPPVARVRPTGGTGFRPGLSKRSHKWEQVAPGRPRQQGCRKTKVGARLSGESHMGYVPLTALHRMTLKGDSSARRKTFRRCCTMKPC